MLRAALHALTASFRSSAPREATDSSQASVVTDTLAGESFPARDLAAVIRPDYLMGGACISVAAGGLPGPLWRITVQTSAGEIRECSLSHQERATLLEHLRDQVAQDGVVQRIPLPRLPE